MYFYPLLGYMLLFENIFVNKFSQKILIHAYLVKKNGGYMCILSSVFLIFSIYVLFNSLLINQICLSLSVSLDLYLLITGRKRNNSL